MASQADSEMLDPELFLSIEDLELATRALVDSVLTGNHRSARLGPGSEFAQHRDYQPGDDLRRINWRLYGRTHRLYVKEVYAEATMPVHVLLDASASMRIGEPVTKYRYASRLAAAIAFLGLRNRDPVGLRIARHEIVAALPARASSTQFHDILAAIEEHLPAEKGNLRNALDDLAEACRKRGTIFILSDFAESGESVYSRLATLREMGHTVVAIQVLAPLEVELPTHGDFEFIDPESGELIKTAVEPIRDQYAAAVSVWRHELKSACTELGIYHASVTTETPLASVLRQITVDLKG